MHHCHLEVNGHFAVADRFEEIFLDGLARDLLGLWRLTVNPMMDHRLGKGRIHFERHRQSEEQIWSCCPRRVYEELKVRGKSNDKSASEAIEGLRVVGDDRFERSGGLYGA